MYQYRVKEVTKIVDGDTIDAVVDLGFNILHKVRVRLYGINAPESRTRDLAVKKLGLAAKHRLGELVEDCFKENSYLLLETQIWQVHWKTSS
jgi:endonuclease YncB( thermonuclease family)